MELTLEKKKCFKRFFVDADVRRHVNVEFANFLDGREDYLMMLTLLGIEVKWMQNLGG